MDKKRIKIIGGTVITPMRQLSGYEVVIAGGVIESVTPRDAATDAGCEMIDAAGHTVVPGLIDLHVHGGGGHDFMDATVEAFHGAAYMHARHGTTTLLPTSLSCPTGDLLEMIAAYRQAVALPWEGANMPGLHLEGPYFSPAQAGAQDMACITPPVADDVAAILAAAQGCILRWSSAPELPGAMPFARKLRANGILNAIGHSDADDTVVAEAVENGYTHITHLYSGMSTITRRASYRYPGVIECAYMYPELTAEIIADGHHLPVSLLRLVIQSLGTHRVALITDALRGAGMPEGPSTLGGHKSGKPCIIEGGVAKLPDRSAFAGSVATADTLLRQVVQQAGIPLQDAVKMMTMTPAAIMGFSHKGIIAPGMDADIVFLDEAIHTARTMISGRFIQ